MATGTREAILRSAQALFLARGYAGVTIGEIAEAANVAVPTVYSSVGNKAGVLTPLGPRVRVVLPEPAREPAVKAVLDKEEDDYVQALTRVADRLIALDGTDRTEALDLLRSCLGPHAWMTLVGERAWMFDRAQAWIARPACRALLKDS